MLFVIGVASLPASPSRLLLLGLLVSYNSLHVMTHGFARYRLPVMPVLFLFAAAAFVELRTQGWPAFSPRRRALAVALSLAFVALLIPSAQTLLRHPAYDLSSPSIPPAGLDVSAPSSRAGSVSRRFESAANRRVGGRDLLAVASGAVLALDEADSPRGHGASQRGLVESSTDGPGE